MSKVDELKNKYSSIALSMFTKFVHADKTPTKKYLEFMLKSWERRPNFSKRITSNDIVEWVDRFENVLPYMDNKDIYSKEFFGNFDAFIEKILLAETIKDEKTFNRDEHARVLLETDDFLFIQPLTHRGSMKYGASTRWCTTAKDSPQTFTTYLKDGLLVYLIDKKLEKSVGFRKVAFFLAYGNSGLNDIITLFDVNDGRVKTNNLISAGWNQDILFEVFTTYNHYFIRSKEYTKTKEYVTTFVNTLSKLDFKKLEESLSKLDESTNVSYIKEARDKVDSFIESLNKTKYGIRKT